MIDQGSQLSGERGAFDFGEDYAEYFRGLARARAVDIDGALERSTAWPVRHERHRTQMADYEHKLMTGSWSDYL